MEYPKIETFRELLIVSQLAESREGLGGMSHATLYRRIMQDGLLDDSEPNGPWMHQAIVRLELRGVIERWTSLAKDGDEPDRWQVTDFGYQEMGKAWRLLDRIMASQQRALA